MGLCDNAELRVKHRINASTALLIKEEPAAQATGSSIHVLYVGAAVTPSGRPAVPWRVQIGQPVCPIVRARCSSWTFKLP
jgi:hypothetical protein